MAPPSGPLSATSLVRHAATVFDAAPPTATESAVAQRALTLPKFDTHATRLRKFTFNVLFVLVVLVLVPVLGAQFFRNDVLIEPIAVPEALLARGMTPEVVASRLWDGLRDAKQLAGTNRAALSATADDQQVQFSVPEVGLSMDSVVRQTRQFFDIYQTRISGEFVCADALCAPQGMRLRLRVVRGSSDVIDMPPIGEQNLRDYFTQAAIRVLSVVDPYIAAAAIYETEPVRGMALLHRLIQEGHPDAKWAHNFIGLGLQLDGHNAEALLQYRAALGLDPNFFFSRVGAGMSLVGLGDTPEARREFDRAAALRPEDGRVFDGYAAVEAAEGRPDEAITLLKRANAADPGNSLYFYRMAEIEKQRGDMEAAEAYYTASLEVDPAGISLANMFELKVGQGDFAAGEAIMRAAVDFRPDNADYLAGHGLALAFLDRSEEALVQFERSLAIAPDNIEVLQQAANMLQNLDRQAEAIAMLDRAIALDPYNPSTVVSRGTSLALTGRSAEARRDFERVLELDTAGTTYGEMAQNFIGILDGIEASPDKDAGPGKAPPEEAAP